MHFSIVFSLSLHLTWCDSIDADPLWRQLLGQGAGKTHNGPLGSRVLQQGGAALVGGHRGGVDDGGAALHVGHRVLGKVEHGEDVCLESALQNLGAGVGHGVEDVLNGRIVDLLK